MTITDDELKAILAGCEGATPGPWDVSADLVRSIDGEIAIPLFDTREPWKKHRRTSTVVRQAWHNQHHIARLDPDTVKAIVTELLALRQSSPPDGQTAGTEHAKRLRETAAVLAAERIQGWANPLVGMLTDAADYLDPPPWRPEEVVVSIPTPSSETKA